MKKVIVTMAVAFLGAAAFAAPGEPQNEKAVRTFRQLFANATSVDWKQVEGSELLQASFSYNGEAIKAFFDNDGQMVAATRYIRPQQLPLSIGRQVAQRYANYAIQPNVIEHESNGLTSYYITLAGNKQDIVLKADADGSLSVYKKTKK
jgi:hypothetical protein